MPGRRELGRSLGSSIQKRNETSLHSSAPVNDEDYSITPIQCPICLENMESLGQLNRHLDDEHVEVTDAVGKLGVRSWFQKQLEKGTKIAPVAAVGKTLNMLEDFEPNGDPGTEDNTLQMSDETVSRTHWARDSQPGLCAASGCARPVKSSRSVHCRHCGRLVCSQHTLYQMRLSRSATYEPHRGFWCRVCQGCYEARPWFLDTSGTTNDHTNAFIVTRTRRINVLSLETQMMEKRMTKLLQSLSTMDNPSRYSVGFLSVLTSKPSALAARRSLEQSIVPWEDEQHIDICPLCNSAFAFDRRKHHCRLCGRCICGDDRTACSAVMSFTVSKPLPPDEKGTRKESARLCRDCRSTLFKSVDHKDSDHEHSQFIHQYQKTRQYRDAVSSLMTRYNVMVSSPRTSQQSTRELSRTKKCIIDSLAQIGLLSANLERLATENSTQTKLQTAIAREIQLYLQAQMLAVQTITGMTESPNELDKPKPEQAIQDLSEQQELREEIAMFTEQRFLLSEQAEAAIRHRKFEDLNSIKASLEEIDRELATKQSQLVLWSSDF